MGRRFVPPRQNGAPPSSETRAARGDRAGTRAAQAEGMSQPATARKMDSESANKRRLRRAVRVRAAHELEPLRVLLVQHDVRMRRLLAAVLREDGYQLT